MTTTQFAVDTTGVGTVNGFSDAQSLGFGGVSEQQVALISGDDGIEYWAHYPENCISQKIEIGDRVCFIVQEHFFASGVLLAANEDDLSQIK